MMRVFGSLAVVALILVASSGCTGFGQTYGERSHRWKMVAKQDMYGFVEDVDLALQTDRPSRLNKWTSN